MHEKEAKMKKSNTVKVELNARELGILRQSLADQNKLWEYSIANDRLTESGKISYETFIEENTILRDKLGKYFDKAFMGL